MIHVNAVWMTAPQLHQVCQKRWFQIESNTLRRQKLIMEKILIAYLIYINNFIKANKYCEHVMCVNIKKQIVQVTIVHLSGYTFS